MLTLIDDRGEAGAEASRRHDRLGPICPTTIRRSTTCSVRADTVGVFQVESRAQMNTLPRMKPRTVLRSRGGSGPDPPRPDSGRTWCTRICGAATAGKPSPIRIPVSKPILERTLGVPLFQEQGMKVAVAAAGFTPSQADELRRAMGHKRSHREDGGAGPGAGGRHGAKRHRQDRRPARSSINCRPSPISVLPNRTPPRLRSWCTSPRFSRCITRRSFTARCSTRSPWASIPPPA